MQAHTGLSHLPEPANTAELATSLRRHYPAEFRQRRVSGSTLVDVHVDAQGRVREVDVVRRPQAPAGQNASALLQGERGSRVLRLNDQPAFGAAAQAALRATRFHPALKDGTPVAHKLRMTVHFDPPAGD